MIELIGNKIFLDDNYEIREYYTEKGNVRALISDECTQSLIYTDKEKINELVLDYFEFYDIPVEMNMNGTDYLMLGGGASSYAHHYLNKYKDKKIDIVEINKNCIEYAKKYFYLDELIENSKDRLNIIIDDALEYITHTPKKYDYILVDLFNGKEPIKEIYNEENILNLKKILKNNGTLIINYIICNNDYTYIENFRRLAQVTNNLKIITNKKYFNNINNVGNIIIIASNNEISISDEYDCIDISDIIK